MRSLDLDRFVLNACVAAAMLAGCGGHAGDGVVPTNGVPDSLHYHKTFNYTGGEQTFDVPTGVTHIKVIARGGKGAGSHGGYGARVHAIIPVAPGEKLVVFVGGDASGATGGFNGGANGGVTKGSCDGYGGGGAPDVREDGLKLSDRLLVAGAGGGEGGAGDFSDGPPGRGGGGGRTGGSGTGGTGSSIKGGGGGGGAQNVGGTGGRGGDGDTGGGKPGRHGSARRGGRGGASCEDSTYCYDNGGGGGGGGGYYGGGGGGAGGGTEDYGGYGGGGGGGSSYAEGSAAKVRFWQAWKQSAHNGLVVFSW